MIYGDYHTHTVYSHGKGSIEENAAKAVEIGLNELGITDHGFMHRVFNVRKKDWPFLKKDIQKAREKFPGLKIFLGLECNILDEYGTIDVDEWQLKDMDLLICGYHKFTKSTSVSQLFKFNLPVLMSGVLHKSSTKRIIANTDAYIRAIEKYPIDIISHPGLGFKADLKQLAKAAAHFGTFLELNGKNVSFTPKEAEDILSEGAKFIINSDAHSPERIGEISKPLDFISKYNIPYSSIENWDKKPLFRGRK